MNLRRRRLIRTFGLAPLLALTSCSGEGRDGQPPESTVSLPAAPTVAPSPRRQIADDSLQEALRHRRSVREFTADPVNDEQLSQLLWAAQGVTHPAGLRTAPSAGALYPLEVYVAGSNGLQRYHADEHRLILLDQTDLRTDVWEAGLRQDALREAALVFVIAAVVERTAAKYGDRAQRYVHLEAGHAAQNILLQAVVLGLGAVPIGAFDDDRLSDLLALPEGQQPLYLIPIGHPRA